MLIENLNNGFKKIILSMASMGLFNCLPDRLYLRLMYRAIMGKRLNLDNPKTYNEKLQWLKLYDRRLEYVKYVDKYTVREYIKEIIGEQYLIPLIGVYDSFDEIDFDKLPNQFVLKCTHDSGSAVVCKEKKNFDKYAAKKKITKFLKQNYFYYGREWPYKSVKPRIICEKYMEDESGSELRDYKFMCFNGVVKCSYVGLNRFSQKGLNMDFYDINWKPIIIEIRHYPNSGTNLAKPKNYEKMIEFAEKLSKGIPHLRVDFYEVDGKLYFGELTFYHASGYEKFTHESDDELLGSWIELPQKEVRNFE